MILSAHAAAGNVPIAEECFTGAAAGRIFILIIKKHQVKEAGLSSLHVIAAIRARRINH